jgi:hypothetical protein
VCVFSQPAASSVQCEEHNAVVGTKAGLRTLTSGPIMGTLGYATQSWQPVCRVAMMRRFVASLPILNGFVA